MRQEFLIKDESNDKKYFTIIPNYVLNHSTMRDREVYIQMKRIAGEKGECWISQNKLAEQCGISKKTIRISLKYLLNHNWIKKLGKKKTHKKDSQGTDTYKITDIWKLNNDFYENDDGGNETRDENDDGGIRNSMTGEMRHDDGGNETLKEEPIEEEPIKKIIDKKNLEIAKLTIKHLRERKQRNYKNAEIESIKGILTN